MTDKPIETSLDEARMVTFGIEEEEQVGTLEFTAPLIDTGELVTVLKEIRDVLRDMERNQRQGSLRDVARAINSIGMP